MYYCDLIRKLSLHSWGTDFKSWIFTFSLLFMLLIFLIFHTTTMNGRWSILLAIFYPLHVTLLHITTTVSLPHTQSTSRWLQQRIYHLHRSWERCCTSHWTSSDGSSKAWSYQRHTKVNRSKGNFTANTLYQIGKWAV